MERAGGIYVHHLHYYYNNNNCTLIELTWKVARYTSAAPVFFTECDGYIDGGVIANNPSVIGLTEIQKHLRKAKKNQKEKK